MRPDAPRDMSTNEIVEEIDTNVREIIDLARSIREISVWDKIMWTLGVGVGVVGVLLAPPTGGATLIVPVASFMLIATDAAKKVSEIRGNDAIRARVAELEGRNSELLDQIRRRFPQRPPGRK